MTSQTIAKEANFDGIVGPTHNYAGLSLGNVASVSHAKMRSFPKAAALQGLTKMKALSKLGLTQGVLAPQARPDFMILRRLGFSGNDSQIVEKAAKQAPNLLAACYSASSMWAANAATVTPSADSADGKVHLTPANLVSKFHRAIEPYTTHRILKATFLDDRYFNHHEPLPSCPHFGDEGAANHTRICSEYANAGLEIFVYGRQGFDESAPKPKVFPARQTLEASQAIARLHQLSPDRTIFAQQNPEVIDQGVFHNDVIAVGNQNVLFFHEQALLNTKKILADLDQFFGDQPHFHIEVPSAQVTVQDAVNSYLFNSQLVTLAPGHMALIAPEECRTNTAVWTYLQSLLQANTPIKEVKVFDVKQSMQNGGGPACLRLRVALTEQECLGVNPNTLISDRLYSTLVSWVEKHYREYLDPDDLADPSLILESRTALDELSQILNLGSIYPFQEG